MRRLPGEARWDADAVRDDLRCYMVDELGDPDAVLITDDTGDLQKGTFTVGSTPSTGRRAGSRTVRRRCSWPTPPRTGYARVGGPGDLPAVVLD
jgi:hypothetical protein